MDYWNIGTLIKELETKVGTGTSTSTINSNLDIINHNIARVFQLLQNTDKRIAEIEQKINKQNKN